MRLPRSARVIGLALALGSAACVGSTAPEAHVRLDVEVLPAEPRAGDTIRLLAILTNRTAERLDLNKACGPPVLFEVTAPGGARVYPVPLDGAFTCPLLDEHELTPWESDTIAVRWRVPASVGPYAVRAGFREGKQLVRLSAPRVIEVRP